MTQDQAQDEPTQRAHDALLLGFLKAIEDGEGRYGMDFTLLIDGVYVSGVPISFPAYLEGIGGLLDGASHRAGGDGASWQTRFNELAATAREDLPDSSTPPMPRHFVHLRDAVILLHGTVVPIPFWRGRLDAVTAWFPGGMKRDGV